MTNIIDATGKEISDVWAAEFCGLFWGEGHLSITRTSRVWSKTSKKSDKYEPISGPFYRMSAMIDLRADDTPLLEEVHRVLGGSLYLSHKNDPAPRRRWATTNKAQIERVCSVLRLGTLPAKKAKEVELFIEANSLRGKKGQKQSDEAKARLEEIYQTLRAMRVYHEL